MTDTTPMQSPQWTRPLSAGLGIAILAVGVLQILSGYRYLLTIRGILLAPDAAFALCLSAMALVLVNGRSRIATGCGRAVAGAVILLALAGMAEATIGLAAGLDRLLGLPTYVPMSATTALGFLFLGVAIWQAAQGRGDDRASIGVLALDVAGTAIVVLLIVASQHLQTNPAPVYVPMDAGMAGLFIALAAGVGLARPQTALQPSPGGALMRRLRLTILVTVASTSLWCLGGCRQGIYGTEISLAVMGTVTMLVTLVLTWRTAGRIDAIEVLRQEALDQARGSDRAKTAFMSNMSHELRTPLNAIIGFSELLEQGVYGDLAPRQQTCIQQVCRGGVHLLQLVNEILDISKVEAGSLKLAKEPVRVPDLIEDVSAFLQPLAAARGLVLTVAEGGVVGEMMADPMRLRQALVNLVSNAIKFTHRDGSVTVRAWEESASLHIAVTDTGIGIQAADLPALFRPFSQLADAAAPIQEGTGLGLFLTKRLVELHGGTITVESQPRVGTTFTIRLPLSPAQPSPVAQEAAPGDVLRRSGLPARTPVPPLAPLRLGTRAMAPKVKALPPSAKALPPISRRSA